MKYPKACALAGEPDEIHVGDLVWWNEGTCVGFIESVLEMPEDFLPWGLDGPCIALTNLHPFQANELKHKSKFGCPTTGGTVMNGMEQLEDEGVGPLSPNERAELQWALAQARQRIAPKYRDAPVCVSAIKDMDRLEADWNFVFVDSECQALGVIVIPFRPGTRTERLGMDATDC